MSIELSFFPTLNEEYLKRIGFEATPYNFKYLFEGEPRMLQTVPTEKHSFKIEYLNLVDNVSEWVPDYYDLYLKRSISLRNTTFLFGKNGLASSSAEIGLALMWTSKTSNQRGVKEIASFKKGENSLKVDFSMKFEKGRLRGNINIQTVLYIKKPGIDNEGEVHLANMSGMIIGTLDQFVIYIDGNGSVFPIVEVSEPSQPLWWVFCDWADPLLDSFDEENVRVCINKSHPNYKDLNAAGGMNNSPLFKEILAGALSIIIQKAKNSSSWNDVLDGTYAESGSIAQAIKYFIETFEWEVNSPEILALSIRKDLDVRI